MKSSLPHKRLVTSLAGLACLFAVTAETAAQPTSSIYTCRDRNGRTLSSDRPIPECADRVTRELGPSGIVKREILPPLTPEQARQKDLDDRRQKLADEVAREKRRRDAALLAAYSSEDQIELARRRALSDAEANIKLSRDRLADLNKEKLALGKETEFYKTKPMPPIVQRKVDDNVAAITDEETELKSRQADVERINQRYDDDLKRYRELVGPTVGIAK